jgi:CRP-like cAMP-binding protein
MNRLRLLAREAEAPCPDCPGVRQDVFFPLIHGKGACAFQCVTLAARDPIPQRWAEMYDFALVRRGILIRQRIDAHGRVTSVDAAGPGCLVLLAPADGTRDATGYAASDAMLCLCMNEVADAALGIEESCARDLVRMQRQAMERMERLADARGRPTADGRVAALLCALADWLAPMRRSDDVPSGLQQRDLAELVGVRHETVCRSLRTLEARGLITRMRDEIRIADRKALEQV